jgi:hypothetical protein
MKPKASVKHRSVDTFLRDMSRAIELYKQFTRSVVKQNPDSSTSPLMQHDRRDIAAFIFLEAAARFEAFSYECFKFTVRKHFRVNSTRAEFIMGSSERGTANMHGWASPERLAERGKNLFGNERFFGCFKVRVGPTVRERLRQAHIIRNRIAHSGSSAGKQYLNLLQTLQVPQKHRHGLSAGRLLMDYPTGATPANRLFFTYIQAYMNYARKFRKHG